MAKALGVFRFDRQSDNLLSTRHTHNGVVDLSYPTPTIRGYKHITSLFPKGFSFSIKDYSFFGTALKDNPSTMTQAPDTVEAAETPNDIAAAELDDIPTTGLKRNDSFDNYVDNMSERGIKFAAASEKFMQQTDVPTPPSPKLSPTSGGDQQWTPKRSFLAESPYFSAFVEKEMHEIGLVTDVLNDISSRTRSFTKYGSLMAEATMNLSLSCRLRREEASQDEIKLSSQELDRELERRRQALGPEMSDLLGILGEVSWSSTVLARVGEINRAPFKIIHKTFSAAWNRAWKKLRMRS